MQWLIQSTGVSERNALPLLEVIKQKNLPFVPVGYIPFEHKLVGLEDVDKSIKSIFYGTTGLLELAPKDFTPGMFYDKEWFDPFVWRLGRKDMLNKELGWCSVDDLRKNWVEDVTFVKSSSPKALTGMVIEPIKQDHDNWIIEQANLDGTEMLVTAPFRKIEKEWRFFIVKRKVVAGSLYRRDGCLVTREPITDEIWKQAQKMADNYLPHETIVMDLCFSHRGYEVVEFNAVNSSGFYNCDISKIVDSLEEHYDGGK